MKNQIAVALCASVIALTACSSSEANVGTRDDIIVINRGDVATINVADMQAPENTAPLLPPEATMETDTMGSDDVNASPVTDAMIAPIAPEAVIVPVAPEAVDMPVQAVSDEVIVPVTTPSVASGAIVVEVPEAVVQTPAGEVESVSNVVTEHQGVDKYAPVQPVVTENQEIDTAGEAVEEIMGETNMPSTKSPERVSPYISTY